MTGGDDILYLITLRNLEIRLVIGLCCFEMCFGTTHQQVSHCDSFIHELALRTRTQLDFPHFQNMSPPYKVDQ